MTEAGVALLTETDVVILASSSEFSQGETPASCYLFAHDQAVYAITSTSIVSMNVGTGVIDALTASNGEIPALVTHGCSYRGRIVLAGYDNGIYASREGDATDWNYSADVGDLGRAALFQLSTSSEIGDVCTALMPFRDTSLLAATRWGIWLIQGDPITGSLQNVSRGVGVIGPRAWCRIEDARTGDALVRYAFAFLSPTGLFLIAPGGDGLQSLSEDRLPEELQDIPETTIVSLVYSPKERGIYVFLTPSSGVETHWFFDLVRQGFWPISMQEVHQPYAICWHDGDVLLAGQDGIVRSIGGEDDDGEDIQSHLLIGPLRLAGPNVFGILTSIHGIMAADSGSVAWRIVTGATAEEACDNGKAAIEAYQQGDIATSEGYCKASGTWTSGRSTTRYARVRSMWVCIWLRSTEPWGYEGITVESSLAGRWR